LLSVLASLSASTLTSTFASLTGVSSTTTFASFAGVSSTFFSVEAATAYTGAY
jgi:hypothetical protein